VSLAEVSDLLLLGFVHEAKQKPDNTIAKNKILVVIV